MKLLLRIVVITFAICVLWASTVVVRNDVRAIAHTQALGVIVASPSGEPGKMTLKWAVTGTTAVEVHVGKPDGDLFASSPATEWTTGEWVQDGMVFYLQDVSEGRALTCDNTVATVVIRKGVWFYNGLR